MQRTLDIAKSRQMDHTTQEQPANPNELQVDHFATANLPTAYGDFKIVAFKNNHDFKDHVAIIKGDIKDQEGVLCRIHSECLTGDVFGSLKCDCGPQLEAALEHLEEQGQGIILYMRQEGRGIGLANKVKAYSLQDQGMDTVEANLHLGFDDDMRDYSVAARMLEYLAPKSIILMTNNPRKLDGLRKAGIPIDERVPLKITPNVHNKRYLETKKNKSGHLL